MPNSLTVFITHSLTMFVPFYVGTLLVAGMKHFKKNFIVRLIIAVLLNFVCIMGLTHNSLFLNDKLVSIFGSFWAGRIVVFIRTIVLIVTLLILYDEKIPNLLSVFAFGITTQNFGYKLIKLVLEFFDIYYDVLKIRWLYLLITAVVYIVIHTFLYFCFIKEYRQRGQLFAQRIEIISVSLVAVFIAAMLGAYSDTFAATDKPLFLVTCVFSLLCNIFIVALILGIFEKTAYRDNVIVLQKCLEDDRKNYAAMKRNMDAINIRLHDLKFHLRSLAGKTALNEEIIEKIEEEIELYDNSVDTGNENLDMIINEKVLYCLSEKIRITCMIDGQAISFIEPADMYSLFGNILDNAIEASKKISAENRSISITSKKSNNILTIIVKNYFDGNIIISNGNFATTKENKEMHGFGIQSIKNIAEKYNGTVSISTDNGLFSISILFEL